MKFKEKRSYALSLLIIMLLGMLSGRWSLSFAQQTDSFITYKPTWESLKKAPAPTWFRDAKFGIFIHWGPYSVIGHRKGGCGYAEHVPKLIYRDPDYYYSYLEERFGAHPPEFGYKDIVALFKAENWNPEEWAELFRDAGAKYVVLTGEHHDGYALWDSELTQWCATKTGPMRDLVGNLGKAVRAEGLKYAPSFHRERHPGFFAKEKFVVNSEPKPDIAEEIKLNPKSAGLYGPFSYTDEFIADYAARWKEIQEKYKPDLMWIDDVPIFYFVEQTPQTRKFKDVFKGLIADYFNAAQQWGKEVYVNNKGGHPNWPEGVGFREKDNLNLTQIGETVWQNPATLGTSFGYMAEEEKRDAYKSPTALIHLLIDVVSKNGNLLLNIGPRADGTIPEGMRTRLLEIGSWLSVNGEAIYETRPWKVYGEGPNVIGDGNSDQNISQKRKGAKNTYSSRSIRYTQSKKGKTVYAIQLVWSEAGKVLIQKLGKKSGLLEHKIRKVSLLGLSAKVDWQVIDEGLEIRTNARKPNEHAFVWKVELE